MPTWEPTPDSGPSYPGGAFFRLIAFCCNAESSLFDFLRRIDKQFSFSLTSTLRFSGPSWHEKYQPSDGYRTPQGPEPYDHWHHTWHLWPGNQNQGQFRTTAPVVESVLLARPWEVSLRFLQTGGVVTYLAPLRACILLDHRHALERLYPHHLTSHHSVARPVRSLSCGTSRSRILTGGDRRWRVRAVSRRRANTVLREARAREKPLRQQ